MPPITVLLYHNLLARGEPQIADKGTIPFDRFEEHLRSLKKAGYRFIGLVEALTSLDQDPSKFDKACVLTFDDAFESLHPALIEIQQTMPCTVFVLTDYVGQNNLWNPRATVQLNHLNLDGLKLLAAAGVDLQLHGVDHHNLLKFSQDELRFRFQAGTRWFWENFGQEPQVLSYPYGACSDLVCATAAEFFQGAVSVNHGNWWGDSARFKLNRISVPSYVDGAGLLSLIETEPDRRYIRSEELAPWFTSNSTN